MQLYEAIRKYMSYCTKKSQHVIREFQCNIDFDRPIILQLCERGRNLIMFMVRLHR